PLFPYTTLFRSPSEEPLELRPTLGVGLRLLAEAAVTLDIIRALAQGWGRLGGSVRREILCRQPGCSGADRGAGGHEFALPALSGDDGTAGAGAGDHDDGDADEVADGAGDSGEDRVHPGPDADDR